MFLQIGPPRRVHGAVNPHILPIRAVAILATFSLSFAA